MTLRVRFGSRPIRKFLPLAVVAMVAGMIVFTAAGNLGSSHQTFAFRVLWPAPSTYVPGTTPPAAYLEINYTGPGTGDYTYVITSNSTGNVTVLGKGSAIVSPLAPFRVYVFVTIPANAVVLLEAQVYGGTASPKNILFSQILSV